MTEQELREKIARIIAKHLCKNRYSHFQLYGDSANCYSRENFAECEAIADTVDALIAADLRFGNKPKIFVENAPIPTTCVDNTIYLVPNTPPMIKQLYGDEEVEQIVKERDEYKHRTEVAERAVYNLAYGEWQREGARRAICEKYAPRTAQDYLNRAEKELEEEGKDENI